MRYETVYEVWFEFDGQDKRERQYSSQWATKSEAESEAARVNSHPKRKGWTAVAISRNRQVLGYSTAR